MSVKNEKAQSKAMSAQEVSDYLRISLSTVHHLTRNGKLKSVKIGKAWRYSKDDVDKYLQGGYGSSVPEEVAPAPSVEHRRHPRISCLIQCEAELFYSTMKRWNREGNVLNISCGGLLFETARPMVQRAELYVGAPVRVRLYLSGADEPELELEGSIVHAKSEASSRFGVKFAEILPTVETILSDMRSG